MTQGGGRFREWCGGAVALALISALAWTAGAYVWSWVDEAVFAASAASTEVQSDREALKKLDRLLADQAATLKTLEAVQQELRSIKIRVTH